MILPMPRIPAFMLAFTALVAGGCAATRQVDYFAPMPSEGVMVTSPSSVPAEVAHYQLGQGDLKLMIQEATPHPQAKLLLTLPSGQTLHLLSATLLATPSASSMVVTATVVSVHANVIEAGAGHVVELAASDAMIGSTDEVGSGRSRVAAPRSFEMVATFDGPLPDRFTLLLPAFQVNGVDTTLPPVKFERKVGTASTMATP
jgi:hypothetical protein